MANGVIIEIEGIEEVEKRLDSLRAANPNMDKQLKKLMRYVINEVKKQVRNDARNVVGKGYPNSGGDPRQAYKAIKSAVYKRLLGGNVSILSKRRRGGYSASLPTHSAGSRYGGNRMARSQRTEDLMSYWGDDRGFVLRFLNSGTEDRRLKNMRGGLKNIEKPGSRGGRSNYANRGTGRRGNIAARGWFPESAQPAMEKAAENLANLIDRAIKEVWDK